MSESPPVPLVSVVVLNYNGERWIERCLASVKAQSLGSSLELIVADNLSTDGSDKTAERILQNSPNSLFVQNGDNLGYCEGNNRAAKRARGQYLLFLNNDAWLEPDCLEKLLAEVKATNASVAMPLVMNYEDDSFQSLGAEGFDIFGLPSTRLPHAETREVLMPEGCAYLIERELFERLGGFDAEFYLYSDELDLSFRAWISGAKAIAVPAAHAHHRGAVNVNPAGGGQVVEFRTSDSKRFYSNRNALLVLLKSGRHMLLLLSVLQIGLLVVEGLVGLLLVRRWSFVKKSYVDALADCWRLRGHIRAERQRINAFRKQGDVWMLRFLRLRLNRWDEVQRVRRYGMPKVTAT